MLIERSVLLEATIGVRETIIESEPPEDAEVAKGIRLLSSNTTKDLPKRSRGKKHAEEAFLF